MLAARVDRTNLRLGCDVLLALQLAGVDDQVLGRRIGLAVRPTGDIDLAGVADELGKMLLGCLDLRLLADRLPRRRVGGNRCLGLRLHL